MSDEATKVEGATVSETPASGRVLTSMRFKAEFLKVQAAAAGLDPAEPAELVVTNEAAWEPAAYAPQIEEALCSACDRWFAPDRFDLDAAGVPLTNCRSCEKWR